MAELFNHIFVEEGMTTIARGTCASPFARDSLAPLLRDVGAMFSATLYYCYGYVFTAEHCTMGNFSSSFDLTKKNTKSGGSCWELALKYEHLKIGLAQKFANSKKSTIFFQSSWYFSKMTNSWIDNFGRILAGLNENCKFFIKSKFLCQSYFLLLIPYYDFYIF